MRERIDRIRDQFDGDLPVVLSALFFMVVGSLLLLVALTSASGVQWTGTAVHGVDRGGIVYYSFNGVPYSLDDTSRFLSHTVYLDPAHPDTSAMLGSVAQRIIDVVSVLVPYTISGLILGYGVRRRRKCRRRAEDPLAGGFGYGLDPEVVQRLIGKRREGRMS